MEVILSKRWERREEREEANWGEAIENWGTASESTNKVQELILKRANQNFWIKNADSFLDLIIVRLFFWL